MVRLVLVCSKSSDFREFANTSIVATLAHLENGGAPTSTRAHITPKSGRCLQQLSPSSGFAKRVVLMVHAPTTLAMVKPTHGAMTTTTKPTLQSLHQLQLPSLNYGTARPAGSTVLARMTHATDKSTPGAQTTTGSPTHPSTSPSQRPLHLHLFQKSSATSRRHALFQMLATRANLV
jgi:hypothetical protein